MPSCPRSTAAAAGKIERKLPRLAEMLTFVAEIGEILWKDAGVVDRGGLENRCAF